MGLYKASELWECRRGQDRFADLLLPPGRPHAHWLTPPVTTFLRHKPSLTLFFKKTSIPRQSPETRNCGHSCHQPPNGPLSSHFASLQLSSITNRTAWQMTSSLDDAKNCSHHHRVQMQGTKPRSWKLNILPEFHSKDSSNTFGFFGFFFPCIYSQQHSVCDDVTKY